MPKTTRVSRLSYYRTPVPFAALRHIASALRYGSDKSVDLTPPAASLLRHLAVNASPGRVPSSGVFEIARPGLLGEPFVIDVLTVEHKDRFVYYLNATPTHRDKDGGFSVGARHGWDMQRRVIAGSGVVAVDADRTPVHAVTNMPGRHRPPKYASPHVLAAASMPVVTNRSLVVTGEHADTTRDVDGFVPEGFTNVGWSAPDWQYPMAIPGLNLHDDVHPRIASSLCSHVEVTGDDPRVVRVSDFR